VATVGNPNKDLYLGWSYQFFPSRTLDLSSSKKLVTQAIRVDSIVDSSSPF